MDVPTHKAEIEMLLDQLGSAHADRNADAVADLYAPNAVIYDLAPPLGRRGMDPATIAAWFATWDGPIRVDTRDVDLIIEGDLAFMSSLTRMRGIQGGKQQDLWFRSTMCFRRANGRWRIVCDHASVPFYMDGSCRAAVDLKP
ncbi:MAG: hypothetical protein RLZZ303_1336 [Candidatus Hydrogenedentota bacterium]|jgi:uncharacterized protein (TIGR02246 family)